MPHAVVFGCSGINGWALVSQLLAGYPSAETFTRVTAVANRPFTAEAAQWPVDERLQLVSGIDLLSGDDRGLAARLNQEVDSAESISHLYYAAYRASDEPADECHRNKDMLRVAVQAVETVSNQLTFVTLITGTKAYGVYLLDKFPFRNQVPLREDLPRVAPEYARDLFYYHQVDLLSDLSVGKSWSWCEVRPDVIVGLAPFGNANCMAQTMGIYLSLYRKIEGENAQVPFPGNTTTWNLLSTDSSQDIVARFCIFASLQPRENVHGNAFNIADSATPVSWSQRWPVMAAYFGLKGTGPDASSIHPTDYIDRHWGDVQTLCRENGLKEDIIYRSMHNTGARMGSLRLMDFDRPFDLTKARRLGFTEEINTETAWYTAFDRVRRANILL